MSIDKFDCAVVRDLLPLYHDRVVSEETKAVVETHVAECVSCAAELEKLDRDLPAGNDKIDTGKSFQKFAKRRKRKHLLLNIICFVIGAVAVFAAALYFMRTKNIIPYAADSFSDPQLIYHYKFDDCAYADHNAHYSEDDHALFIYMPEPVVCDSEITRSNGDVNIIFKHAIWNPQQYGMGLRYRIWIVPIDDECKTLSINGKKVYDIGAPDTELPSYVEAYHELQSKDGGMWDEEYIGEIDHETPCDYFVYYPDGNDTGRYTKWDLDGNVIENTLE